MKLKLFIAVSVLVVGAAMLVAPAHNNPKVPTLITPPKKASASNTGIKSLPRPDTNAFAAAIVASEAANSAISASENMDTALDVQKTFFAAETAMAAAEVALDQCPSKETRRYKEAEIALAIARVRVTKAEAWPEPETIRKAALMASYAAMKAALAIKR